MFLYVVTFSICMPAVNKNSLEHKTVPLILIKLNRKRLVSITYSIHFFFNVSTV